MSVKAVYGLCDKVNTLAVRKNKILICLCFENDLRP